MIEVKRFVPDVGDRIRVHMNLHKRKLSVRLLETGNFYDRTLLWTDELVLLEDVEFRTSKKIAEKIRDEGVRQVCAYTVGTLEEEIGASDPPKEGKRVRFNPFKSNYFHLEENGERLDHVSSLALWMEDNNDKMLIPDE